jgi:hypothetical protein
MSEPVPASEAELERVTTPESLIVPTPESATAPNLVRTPAATRVPAPADPADPKTVRTPEAVAEPDPVSAAAASVVLVPAAVSAPAPERAAEPETDELPGCGASTSWLAAGRGEASIETCPALPSGTNGFTTRLGPATRSL